MSLELPKLIVHRGASLYAPENTLAALRKAHEMGAEWVEFDVMLAKYGTPIIFHDNKLDRTTNGHGLVAHTPYSIIETLDAGSWFSSEFNGEKVPTLDEWLTCASSLNLGINLEMKVKGKRKARLLAEKIVVALARNWNHHFPAPLISSFFVSCLQAIRALTPNLMLGYIIYDWSDDAFRILDQFNCVSLHVYHENLTPERVVRIKETGRKALAYTVDDAARAQELFDMGVDAIFSNDLKLLGK